VNGDIPTEFDNPFPEPVDLEITDSIDLHAFRPKDVKAVIESYLAEANAKGFRLVRIIHGKGIGIQREITRKVLNESELVKGFKSGDEFSGGWGATIVEFKTGR
jgi:dsDNA-specific endonuclease/ATPase MutS2